jgi:pimeloyl-ACP methyl ester carboxylesterase
VVDSIVQLNYGNLPELEGIGLDFRNKLDVTDLHYMGHSFGGATVLHAAKSRPPRSVLVYDPASDWMPTESRLSLFDLTRLKGSSTNHSYWTRCDVDASICAIEEGDEKETIHDTTQLFVLFSDQWHTQKWGGSDVLKDMFDRNVLGPRGGVSKFGVIEGAFHQEFSDASMLTPLWIAREVGLTGPRNPLDTAREIHLETITFLKNLRRL